MELEHPTPYTYRLPRTGAMRTDGVLYADAKLRALIEGDATLTQLANVATLPGIVGSALAMPDAHQGYGFPIGGVAAMDLEKGVVSPGGIGYDINCGVRLLTTPFTAEEIRPRMRELVDRLFARIPCGAGRDGTTPLSPADLDAVLRDGAAWCVARGIGTEHDREHTESLGRLPDADPDAVTHAAKRRGKNQLGTLGSGNHFLEVQRVTAVHHDAAARAMGLAVGNAVVLFHCGSRGLGHQTCADHLEIMGQAMAKYGITIPDRELACAPIRSPEGETYLRAMRAAANFAFANRQCITAQTRLAFADVFGPTELRVVYDVCHNIAKIEEHIVGGVSRRLLVHRKGATRAFPPGHPEVPAAYRALGQPVIIPGSMGTASYVLLGRPEAMRATFGSTCHGAGRVMSRTKAKRSMHLDELRRAMRDRDIVMKGASAVGMLEEIPEAYKDIHAVVEVVHNAGLSTKVALLAPMGVIKG